MRLFVSWCLGMGSMVAEVGIYDCKLVSQWGITLSTKLHWYTEFMFISIKLCEIVVKARKIMRIRSSYKVQHNGTFQLRATYENWFN